MNEDNRLRHWAELILQFVLAFIPTGLVAGLVVLLVWNTFAPGLSAHFPIAIWLVATTSVSIWAVRTEREGWFRALFW